MKLFYFLSITLIAFTGHAACPDAGKKETMLDCPWAEIARQISVSPKFCKQIVKKMAPETAASLRAEAGALNVFNFWGEAKNFDDNAKGIIVDPTIIDCLAKEIKLKNPRRPSEKFEIVHAGLQHTYSYLFSNLETPYGYKRARWVSGDVQTGLGLDVNSLLPQKESAGFLTNVTYLFAKLAYSKKPELLESIQKPLKKNLKIDPHISAISTSDFEIKTLIEDISRYNTILKTTFVKFKIKPSSSKNAYLLIYSYEDKSSGKVKLITGFPVDQSSYEKTTDATQLGDDKPISVRYNAWINGISDSNSALKGSRKLIP